MFVDFRRLTEKDLFMLRLKGEYVDFGFIPKWQRRKFLRFLKDNGFIRPYCFPNESPHWSWKAQYDFSYTVTWVDIKHLPLGFLAEWFYDITLTGLQHRSKIRVSRNNNKKPGFDYIMISGDLIYG